MPQDWFKCLRKKKKKRSCPFSSATARRKKRKKCLSSDWAENLAESNKGLLLRPGANYGWRSWTSSQALKATRRFPHEHLVQPIENRGWRTLKIWKAKTLKHGKSSMAPLRSRWKTTGEDQWIGDLSLLSRKCWICGKLTNLVPLECSSVRTKTVGRAKLILYFRRLKKARRSR